MRRSLFKYIFKALFFSVAFLCHGQSVDNLRSRREGLLEEIRSSNLTLQRMVASRENSLKQLVLLSREITVREQLIEGIKEELASFDTIIANNQLKADELEFSIKYMREEYARLIRDTYFRRHALDELVFFMSASSFSEAYRRFRLLREYSAYRRSQGELLLQTRQDLDVVIAEIKSKREQKELVIIDLQVESRSLDRSKGEKERLIETLRKEEQWLRRDIARKTEQAKVLEREILDYIRTAREGVTGTDFNAFAGRLAWPVNEGVIVNRFGDQPHPVLRNVTIRNNGIGIQVTGSDNVLAVHPGEVSRVVAIPGYNSAVIVRHGRFLTVYANLSNIAVVQGQSVNLGTVLGNVYKGPGEDRAILHFEIWNQNEKLDPAIWLRK